MGRRKNKKIPILPILSALLFALTLFQAPSLHGSPSGISDNLQADESSGSEFSNAEISLLDGTMLKGRLCLKHMDIQTPYGLLNIPAERIKVIEMKQHRGSGTIIMTDGDRISFVVEDSQIPFDSILGTIHIPLKTVSIITFESTETTKPEKLFLRLEAAIMRPINLARVEIQFSQEMVDQTEVRGKLIKGLPDWAGFSPESDGYWYWKDTKTWRFEPNYTVYDRSKEGLATLTIDAGVTSLQGNSLEHGIVIQFRPLKYGANHNAVYKLFPVADRPEEVDGFRILLAGPMNVPSGTNFNALRRQGWFPFIQTSKPMRTASAGPRWESNAGEFVDKWIVVKPRMESDGNLQELLNWIDIYTLGSWQRQNTSNLEFHIREGTPSIDGDILSKGYTFYTSDLDADHLATSP